MAESEVTAPENSPSEETSSQAPDVIASDLFETDGAPLSETVGGFSDTSAQAQFDPSSVDLRHGKLEDIPEAHQATYAPLFKMAKDLEAGATRRDQDLQDQLQHTREAEKEWRDKITELATGQQPEVDQRHANLTDEQMEGINVVKDIVREELQPLGGFVEQFNQVQNTVNQLQQDKDAVRRDSVAQQISDARQSYGNDVDAHGMQIAALMNAPNPRTNQPYTVKEAYEIVSGKAQAASERAVRRDAATRMNAKASVSGVPGMVVDSADGKTDLSMHEARSYLEELGFER